MIDDKILKQSEFNAAKAISLSLVNWFEECNTALINDDYIAWFKALLNCYKMVHCKLTKDELEKLEPNVKNLFSKNKEYINKLSNPTAKILPFSTDFPNELFNVEIEIRKYADVHGMLNPSKKSMEDEEES